MTIRYISSTASSSSNTETKRDSVGGVACYSYLSLTEALEACDAAGGDIVELDPDSPAFLDAAGFRLKTVTIPLATNLTISKACTIRGGTYRLRIDGANNTSQVAFDAACNVSDVDFVYCGNNGRSSCGCVVNSASTFTRCLFCGALESGVHIGSDSQTYDASFTDCAFYGNEGLYDSDAYNIGSVAFVRCVGRLNSDAQIKDCINLYNLDQTTVNAIGFVSPPKVYDASNPGYYTDGTERNNADWESVDLRLLSTSSYATGNSLTTDDGIVYDLAGNKRSTGGAFGAYECLSDVDLWYKNAAWHSDAACSTTGNLTSTSVCQLEENVAFADENFSVSKIYVPGWTRVNLGNNGGGAEVVLGLGATVDFSGEITAQNITSDELLQYKPSAGSKLVLKNCNIKF